LYAYVTISVLPGHFGLNVDGKNANGGVQIHTTL